MNRLLRRSSSIILVAVITWILATSIFLHKEVLGPNFEKTWNQFYYNAPANGHILRPELLNGTNLTNVSDIRNNHHLRVKKAEEVLKAAWPPKARLGDEGNENGFGDLTIVENTNLYAFMKLTNYFYEPVWAPKFCHYEPETVPADCIEGFGYGGQGVHVNRSLLTEREKILYDQGLEIYTVNQMASDRIPLRREISLDMPECKNFSYDTSTLPTAGVVLIFTDEMWSTLIRTIFSILDAGPEELITEIIIVDDASTRDYLSKPLDEYVRIFGGKVKVVRMPERKGLIAARLAGFDLVTGDVAVFLDAHCEVTTGWLEPLLYRIKQDPTVITVPIVDAINWETFKYQYSTNDNLNSCGFDFNMIYTWRNEPAPDGAKRKTLVDPIMTATHSGCCFAVSKETFNRLGKYDPALETWGCENMELSFKTWMCGGRMELLPCSHIGHVYRPKFPYKWPNKPYQFQRNCLRVAEVWMDQYQVFYKDRISDVLSKINIGDLSERKALREKLKCRSFDWFIKELNPGLYVPLNTSASGRISSVTNPNFCIQRSIKYDQLSKPAFPGKCAAVSEDQYFILTKEKQIRRDDGCLGHDADKNLLVARNCDKDQGHWEYTQENTIRNVESNRCIALSVDNSEIKMAECNASNTCQQWMWPRKNILQ